MTLVPIHQLLEPHPISLFEDLLRGLHLLHALVVLVNHQFDEVLSLLLQLEHSCLLLLLLAKHLIHYQQVSGITVVVLAQQLFLRR